MTMVTVTTREIELPLVSSCGAIASSCVDQADRLAFSQALVASLGKESLSSGVQPQLRELGSRSERWASTTRRHPTFPSEGSLDYGDRSSDAESDTGSDRTADSFAIPALFPVQPLVPRQASSRSSIGMDEHAGVQHQEWNSLRMESAERDRSRVGGGSPATHSGILAACEVVTSTLESGAAPGSQILASDIRSAFTASLSEVLRFNPVAWSLSAAIQTAIGNETPQHPQQMAATRTSPSVSTEVAGQVAGALPPDPSADVERQQQSGCSTGNTATELNQELKFSIDEREVGEEAPTPVNHVVDGLAANVVQQGEEVAFPASAAGNRLDSHHEQARSLEQFFPQLIAERLHPEQIQFNLELAELGFVKIVASLKEGRLTARFDAQSPDALRALHEHLSELEAALVRQGLTVDLQVSQSDEQGEWQRRGDRQSPKNTGEPLRIEPGSAVEASGIVPSIQLSGPALRGKARRDHLDIHV